MSNPVQPRSLKTRAKLIDAARAIVGQSGLAALRVEDVVARADVAKGTFFAHFADKDGLLVQLIAERLNAALDRMEALPPPGTVDAMLAALDPLLATLTDDRIVFDIAMRYSGGMGPAGDTGIASNTERQVALFARWIANAATKGAMRADQPPELLAEGVQAFAAQTVALHFCEVTRANPAERLGPFLRAWLEIR